MIIQKSLKNNSSILIVLDVILIVCALVFIPKLSSVLFPQKQAYSLNQFLQQTETTKLVNSQQFWQFREFYSPGYFLTTTNHIENSGITLTGNNVTRETYFTSPKLLSIDALTSASSLSAVLQVADVEKVILQTKTLLIIQRQHDLVLAFILPESEMERANGLFNYQEDTDLLNGKSWFNVTIIK